MQAAATTYRGVQPAPTHGWLQPAIASCIWLQARQPCVAGAVLRAAAAAWHTAVRVCPPPLQATWAPSWQWRRSSRWPWASPARSRPVTPHALAATIFATVAVTILYAHARTRGGVGGGRCSCCHWHFHCSCLSAGVAAPAACCVLCRQRRLCRALRAPEGTALDKRVHCKCAGDPRRPRVLAEGPGHFGSLQIVAGAGLKWPLTWPLTMPS